MLIVLQVRFRALIAAAFQHLWLPVFSSLIGNLGFWGSPFFIQFQASFTGAVKSLCAIFAAVHPAT